MTPVDQTILSSEDGTVKGNCFTACIASLFDMKIEDVPYFAEMGENWYPQFKKFIRENGYEFHGMHYFKQEGDWLNLASKSVGVDSYFIIGGESWRDYVKAGHAVIYNSLGILCHDPHFSRQGVKKIEYAYMIERRNEID